MGKTFGDILNQMKQGGGNISMKGKGNSVSINGKNFNLNAWKPQAQQAPQTTNDLSRAAYERAFKPFRLVDSMNAADMYASKPMGIQIDNRPKAWEDYGNEVEQEEEHADDFEEPSYSKPTSRTQQELADRRMQRMIADRVRRNRQNMMNIGKRRKYVQGVVNESHNYDMDDPDQRDEFTRYTGAYITEDGDIEGVELPSDDFNKRYGL